MKQNKKANITLSTSELIWIAIGIMVAIIAIWGIIQWVGSGSGSQASFFKRLLFGK